MNLTDNFTVAELTKSSTATRKNIDNTPGVVELLNAQFLSTAILEPIRSHFKTPYAPSSWYRSLALNTAIGSSSTSQHVKGQAADIEVPGISNYELAAWIRDNLLFDQIILENYKPGVPDSGWVHVSYVLAKNRGSVLTFSNGKYTKGLTDDK